eukprot:3737189-Pyramimonas_sp.AAC.1
MGGGVATTVRIQIFATAERELCCFPRPVEIPNHSIPQGILNTLGLGAPQAGVERIVWASFNS